MTATLFEVTTFGEIMLRFSVPAGERLEMTGQLDVRPGGAEANLASLLARLGRRSAWCGALPGSALGRLAANALRMAGVDLAGVVWADDCRMGTYYVEFSAPPRPIQVIYDRADSCAAHLQPNQVNWTHLLDTRLLHLTGITPALSPTCRAAVAEAIDRAHRGGVAVSFDVNYRQKLWRVEDAAATLLPLVQGVDLLFCGQSDAAQLFDCTGAPESALQKLAALSGAKSVVMSIGEGGALATDGAGLYRAKALSTEIVDRLGAGDALAAGVIDGWLAGDLALGLRRGMVLAALALTQRGDFVVTTRAEVEALLAAAGPRLDR